MVPHLPSRFPPKPGAEIQRITEIHRVDGTPADLEIIRRVTPLRLPYSA